MTSIITKSLSSLMLRRSPKITSNYIFLFRHSSSSCVDEKTNNAVVYDTKIQSSNESTVGGVDESNKKYWSRENWVRKKKYDYLLKFSPESMTKAANILSLSDANDVANEALNDLPFGAKLLGTGTSIQDFSDIQEQGSAKPNILFVSPSCPKARIQLPIILAAFPSIEWVHCRSAGIDFIVSEELSETKVMVTNAKGQFSSSLAEYSMMACSYFAKNLPRLMKQQQNKEWIKYDVEELRGKTMGIVGYGDIGM